MIQTVFFGTHTFATTILQALLDDPTIEVSLVITQPDKPVGRKKVMTPPPVKLLATAHHIPVVQPETLKGFELPGTFDIGVTAQYGLLVPKYILDTPTHGILNVHTSLLPKYRGASPIQSALIAGDTQTGVTIMKMDVGLDTGPILLQQTLQIAPDDTYLILDQKLATLAAPMLIDALKSYVAGSCILVEQDHTAATHCSQLSREDGHIEWSNTTTTIYNQYRGMTPWPGIWTMLDGRRLKLLSIQPNTRIVPSGSLEYHANNIHIGTADGSIVITELQLEGKPVQSASQFIQGYPRYHGSTLT